MLDNLVSPVLLLAATPLFVSRLGIGEYGVWMLANSIVGTLGIFMLGLGDAIVKNVSALRVQRDKDVAKLISAGTALYGVVAGVVAIAGMVSAPAIATVVKGADADSLVLVLRLSFVLLVIRSLDAVFGATLRGYERYDLAARVGISTKVGWILTAMALVIAGVSVPVIVASTCVVSACGVVALAVSCRAVVPGFSPRPRLDPVLMRAILGFSLYSWLQGLGGLLFGQADRLAVGAILGVRALGYYTICTQLAQQSHAVSAAAFHVVFPRVSSAVAAGQPGRIRGQYRRLLALDLGVIVLIAMPLVLLARPLLSIWLGPQFARDAHSLLVVLTIAYALLAISVVPHNTLLGLGRIRFVAVVNLMGGIMTLAGVVALSYATGLVGAGLGNLFYGPVASANLVAVHRALARLDDS